MNNDKFQPIPKRCEIIPDVETFRFVKNERSYYIQGIIRLPDGTEINAIIRYKVVYEDDGEIFRPIEYIRREIA